MWSYRVLIWWDDPNNKQRQTIASKKVNNNNVMWFLLYININCRHISHLHKNYLITICIINYPIRLLLALRVIMQKNSFAYWECGDVESKPGVLKPHRLIFRMQSLNSSTGFQLENAGFNFHCHRCYFANPWCHGIICTVGFELESQRISAVSRTFESCSVNLIPVLEVSLYCFRKGVTCGPLQSSLYISDSWIVQLK